MRILLDTHEFIWMHQAPELLSKSAILLIEDEENQLFLSMASVWEMQIKIDLKKLELSHHLVDVIATQKRENGVQLLPIEVRHIYGLSLLERHHRDPFDRLLIAQSNSEAMPILTADGVFDKYNAQILR